MRKFIQPCFSSLRLRSSFLLPLTTIHLNTLSMHSTSHWRELIQLPHLNALNDMYIVYNILSGHMNNTFE